MPLSFLKKLLFKHEFTRNLSLLIGTSVVGYGITLLLSPVLTRLYDPTAFGVLQVFLSWCLLGAGLICARYETAILIPKDEKTAFSLAVISFSIAIVLCVFCVFIVLGLKLFGQDISQVILLNPYLWFFPPALLFIGTYQIFSQLAVRNQAFKEIGKTKITQSVGQALVQLSLGITQTGAWGLIIGDVVGRFWGIIYLSKKMIRSYQQEFHKINFSYLRQVAWRYRTFPLVSSWSTLINTGAYIIPNLLFTDYYGLYFMGLYALSERVFSSPKALIGQSVSQVYNGTASKHLNDPTGLLLLYRKLAIQLFLLGAIPFLPIIVFGESIFGWVFGHEWKMAGYYAQILACMQWFEFVASPLSQTLNLLEKQHWQLRWDILRLLLCILSIYIAHSFFDNPFWGITAYAISLSLMYGVHIFLCNLAIKRISS
ncbi:MAG: oligosaccharide flippase family protein [Spirosomataceae bacterium]